MTFFALIIVIVTKEADFAEHFSGPVDGIKKVILKCYLCFDLLVKKNTKWLVE